MVRGIALLVTAITIAAAGLGGCAVEHRRDGGVTIRPL